MAGIAQLSGAAIPDRFCECLLESADCFWLITLGTISVLVAVAHHHPGSRDGCFHGPCLGAALVELARTRALHTGHTRGADVHLVAGLLESVDWISKVIKTVWRDQVSKFLPMLLEILPLYTDSQHRST